ncbi:hypothetical protein ACFYNO_05740 [Kitasatospora sp. NPDC006697]|uniref:LppU/SCO3897 family protein n=1 Tax=Kitasatospora sp. NPDC006697 TaxID=3364020 RepID=UPI0036857936
MTQPDQPNPYAPVPPPPAAPPVTPPAPPAVPAAPPVPPTAPAGPPAPPAFPPVPPPAVPAQQNPWAAPPQQPPAYGYGAPGQGGQPQPGYGAPAYGGYPQQAGYGTPVMLNCRVCGGFPAADVTVRGHRGMLVLMRFLTSRGPFCQVCGTATVREMSAQTLLKGWWSYLSWLFTLIALIGNRSAYQKIRRLPAPQPGTHGPQLDPGRPLTKRGAIWMLALPVAAVALAIALPIALAGSTTPAEVTGASVDTAQPGDCLHDYNAAGGVDDSKPSVVVVPCSSKSADFKVVARVGTMNDGSSVCSHYSVVTKWFQHQEPTYSYVLCLAPPNAALSGGDSGSGGSSGSSGSSGSGSSGGAAT